MPKEETCSNCHRVIGADETAFVHQNEIICRECYSAISVSEPVRTGEDLNSRLERYNYRDLLPIICFLTGFLIWLLGLTSGENRLELFLRGLMRPSIFLTDGHGHGYPRRFFQAITGTPRHAYTRPSMKSSEMRIEKASRN